MPLQSAPCLPMRFKNYIGLLVGHCYVSFIQSRLKMAIFLFLNALNAKRRVETIHFSCSKKLNFTNFNKACLKKRVYPFAFKKEQKQRISLKSYIGFYGFTTEPIPLFGGLQMF